MAILDILNRPMFHSRFKLPIRILIGILVVVVIGLSIPRLFMKNQPQNRSDVIAIVMGVKSLILLAYLLAAEHIERFQRWHNYKANITISFLEITLWGAVAFLGFQANLSRCEGVSCSLSWIVFVVALVLNHLEMYILAIAIREFREYRKTRDGIPLSSIASYGSAMEETVQILPSRSQNVRHGHYQQQNEAPPVYHVQMGSGK